MKRATADLSRRSFLGASMMFAGGAALAACSTNPQSGGTGGAKVVLNQWYHAYGEPGTQQAVQRYAAQYTKENPGVAVKITWVAGDYETKLNAALLAGTAPDVFEIGDFRHQLVTNGHLAPLDDILGSQRSEFSQAALDTVTVGGKVYGIKMIEDVMMLYFRKSALDKAGLSAPQTFDQLVQAAKKLTTGSTKGLFLGNDGIGDAGYLLLWSNGAELVNGTQAAFATPQAAQAVAGLHQLHQSGALLQGFTTDWYDPSAIVQGAAAMHWCGLWAMPAITKQLGDDFGVIPWPAFSAAGSPVSRVGGWYELVNAHSSHVDEAKKFVQWLWLRQNQLEEDWAVNYGFHVPGRATVAASAAKLSTGPVKEAVQLGHADGKSFPGLWNTACQTAFGTATTQLAQNGGDAQRLLQSAAATCQAEFAKQLG